MRRFAIIINAVIVNGVIQWPGEHSGELGSSQLAEIQMIF
jgi:hypothetical protein